MQKTNIPWTEYTWNPSVGCELPLASTGCQFCYARQLHNTRHKAYLAGKKLPKQYARPFEEIQLFPDRIDGPLHKRNPCNIFVGSMTDLFCPSVPFSFIEKVMATIEQSPQHTYQMLTKRPHVALEYFNGLGKKYELSSCPNLWFGASISNQPDADRIIPILLQIPAAVRFVSIEPMLGEINIKKYLHCGIGWCIMGCESGKNARTMDENWVRSLICQCKETDTAVFYKQKRQGREIVKMPEIDGQVYDQYPQITGKPNEN